MPNSSSKESDRRYGGGSSSRRKSSDEEHYSSSKSCSMPMQSYMDFNSSRSSNKEKKVQWRTLGDWSEFMSSSGKIYYYNCKTEKTQWDKPEEWDWMLQEEKNSKLEKSYYSSSKDYKTNRYRNKYENDQFDSSNSKQQRYMDHHKNYQRDYANDYNNISNLSSSGMISSFRPNSYGGYMLNDQLAHNRAYNIPSSSIMPGMMASAAGSDYYDSNLNQNPNDYYNYRNYAPQQLKNDQDKYWNDPRQSKIRSNSNQKSCREDPSSYKMSPANYQMNTNYNYDDPMNHVNKQFLYQKQHTSRFETYNTVDSKLSSNDQYHFGYNNQNSSNVNNSNYYASSVNNNNISNNNAGEYEMREPNMRFNKYSSSSSRNNLDQQDLTENYNSNSNNNNRTHSRSKSSSNLSRSRSRSSSRSSSASSNNQRGKNRNSHKRSKRYDSSFKSSSSKFNDLKSKSNSPNNSNNNNKTSHQSTNYQDSNKNYNNDNENNNNTISNINSSVNSGIVTNNINNHSGINNSQIKTRNENADTNESNTNHNYDYEKSYHHSNSSQKHSEDFVKSSSSNLKSSNNNDDSNEINKKQQHSTTDSNSDKKDHSQSENHIEDSKENHNIIGNNNSNSGNVTNNQSNKINESTNQHHSHSHQSLNVPPYNVSLLEPALSSTLDDINKYYKHDLLNRLTGIDLNENLNLINSQIVVKNIAYSNLAAELKNYRSLVRLKEIKKTLQEQRLLFLQSQMKEIEELLT